ncbi:universal stress protein [Halalkalicoccus jeotgali]|uniref:UspA domain protein n=1 Tax=Halalkalicoccus jeotgali (strain DSM 18796 / CECT 7217 / JCM 14584 / KCTC 4019 / B3) TaxID=795797 RepID=D8J4W8_HALJB|nr:universal stress protein [Halalkalicoccus jeotgali]ADJ15585.1 uspA domain protein [Halalkalicoccus jeotgali B3]ELY36337.1 uspA domain-containing protein [Halalkalicoccus jeotgali B3]
MQILVPIDGSGSSFDALRFGVEFARGFDADLAVVHFAAERTEATDDLFERARGEIRDGGLEADPELIETDVVTESGAARKVGERIVSLARERGYDHVVMGRATSGRLERFVVGSASEAVVEESDLPVTLIP